MVAENYTDYMFNLIKRVMDEIGPRESCSENEKKLGNLLVNEWDPLCDRVSVEPFKCNPSAFFGFLPFTVLFYIGALIFYWFFPPVSFIFIAVGASVLLFELIRYHEFIDVFFPEKTGENIVGTILPKGEIRQRVIISAHLDSAYEFNLWYYLKNAAIPVMIAAGIGVILVLFASAAKTIAYVIGSADLQIYSYLGIACAAFSPFILSFMFFHTYKPVPGAMDDMSGVAVMTGLGKSLSDAKGNNGVFPENTEVVLVGMACEEAGLRGAKRYIAKHINELKSIPTYGLFLDGIYDERHLTVITREIFNGARHNPELIKMAVDAAAARNRHIKKAPIPLGASDASAFSLAGIPSVCILCQDSSRLAPNYHTRYDTIHYIRPESLAVSLQLIIDMLQKIDKK
ncbi:MAG: DUF4910 domain-containing protein [bacterium]